MIDIMIVSAIIIIFFIPFSKAFKIRLFIFLRHTLPQLQTGLDRSRTRKKYYYNCLHKTYFKHCRERRPRRFVWRSHFCSGIGEINFFVYILRAELRPLCSYIRSINKTHRKIDFTIQKCNEIVKICENTIIRK